MVTFSASSKFMFSVIDGISYNHLKLVADNWAFTISRRKMKMKPLKKQVLTTITLILMLTITSLMTTVNFASADVTTNIDTFSFILPAPSPVGVNQQVVVTFLIDKVNPVALIRSNWFTDITVTITKPDGNTETKTGLSADSTSAGWFVYTPDQVGTYYFEMSFPGQWANSTAGTMTMFGPVLQNTYRWYKPSTSAKVPLVVQQNPIEKIATLPFPTDYWKTPVYSENKGWTQHIDNWLMPAYDSSSRAFNGQIAFSPYTTAANSAHVLWTQQLEFGGLVSEQFGDKSYYTGLVYEQFYMPLILSGRIIYNDHGPTGMGGSMGASVNNLGARCLDLYTGEEIWYLENVTIDFAQTLSIDTPNEHGVLPYLWSAPGSGFNPTGGPSLTSWTMYDAWTGRQIATVANATPGTTVFGPKGELLSYTYDSIGNKLTMWNSSKCIFRSTPPSIFSGGGEDAWSPPVGMVADWNKGIEWSVTIPPVNALAAVSILAISVKENAILVGPSLLYPNDQPTYPPTLTFAAYPATLQRQADGNYPTSANPLWVKNQADINGYVELHYNINEGMYSLYDDAAQRIHTYDIQTGNELSVTDPISPTNSLWAVFSHGGMAYGRNYIWGYDGHVRCFDGKTGALLWDFALPSAGLETVYGTYPIYAGCTIADHKVYVSADEHSPDADMWRGDKLYCLDADTGKELWSVSGYYHYQTISNGYVTAVNSYDQTIYTFGKGPSATTVLAPQTAVPKGTTVMITGTVTDQSPGQKGTAAVSDGSMGTWMEYLHMQKPKPTDATGVQVILSAIDSNGNEVVIGTATSDTNGNYGFAWTPTVEGAFYISAKFAGTASYGSSEASTYMAVSQATSTSSSQEQSSNSGASTEFYIIIALVVVIAIIAVAVILRRRM